MDNLIKDYIKSILPSALAWGLISANVLYRVFVWLIEIRKITDITGKEIINFGLYSISNNVIYYGISMLISSLLAIMFGLFGIVFMLDYEHFRTQLKRANAIFLLIAIGITVINIIFFR